MCQHHVYLSSYINSSAWYLDKVAAVGHEKPAQKLIKIIFIAKFCQIMTHRACSANMVGGLDKKSRNLEHHCSARRYNMVPPIQKTLAGLASKLAIPTCHGASIQKYLVKHIHYITIYIHSNTLHYIYCTLPVQSSTVGSCTVPYTHIIIHTITHSSTFIHKCAPNGFKYDIFR